jgi:hypothetical protein
MNTRGSILTDHWMEILIGIIVVVVVLFVFKGKSEAAQQVVTEVSPNTLQFQVIKCGQESKLAIDSGVKVDDGDHDKYLDPCDTCWGGDDAKQSDQDWVADACDQDDMKAAKTANEACCGIGMKECGSILSASPFRCEQH